MNLGKILEVTSDKYGDNTALFYEGRRYTYHELNRAVNGLSHGLKGLAVGKGDKVAIMLPNCPEFVISYFAAVKAGAVAVTVSALSTSYELKHILTDSDAKILITVDSMVKKYEEIKQDLPLCRHLIVVHGHDHALSFQSLIDRVPSDPDLSETEDHDPAVMIYTAGLTGRPLGAVLTHGNLLAQSSLVRDVLRGNHEDRCLSLIPLHHSFGAVGNMIAAIRIGAGMVLMDRFTLDGIFAAIERERITYLAAVPRLFLGMIFHEGAGKYDISSLRVCITGGSAMPAELIPVFQERFRVKLLEGYGLTEASPVCAVTRPEMVQKFGSVGVVIAGVEARIVNGEGKILPPNREGELIVRGPNIMKGYYKDHAASAQVIKDHWLYTSDLGRMDEDGYIFLTGRKKRMIITSGFNVYPREVEVVLKLHEAVAETVVLGKEDLLRGEIVKALVVKKPGVEVDDKEIMRHCRVYLSSYKVPREVEFVAALPL